MCLVQCCLAYLLLISVTAHHSASLAKPKHKINLAPVCAGTTTTVLLLHKHTNELTASESSAAVRGGPQGWQLLCQLLSGEPQQLVQQLTKCGTARPAHEPGPRCHYAAELCAQLHLGQEVLPAASKAIE